MVNAVRCVKMYYKRIRLLVVMIKLLTTKIKNSTVTKSYLIRCNKCLKQQLDKQQTCFDQDGITIKIILGYLIEEKTVCKDTFTNILSYQVILVFCNILMLLLLIRPILGHPLSVEITGFMLWNLMLKMDTELLIV